MLRRGTIRPARGLAVALALVSVTLTPLAAEAKLRIVATLPDLWALTSAVVGDEATVEMATRFGQNPHDMEIRPSQTLLIRQADVRSEEHTSELQSRFDLVCRLLLEKK